MPHWFIAGIARGRSAEVYRDELMAFVLSVHGLFHHRCISISLVQHFTLTFCGVQDLCTTVNQYNAHTLYSVPDAF